MMLVNQRQPERRSAERFPVSLIAKTDRGAGTTRDISVSGVYLISRQRFAPGDHVRVVIALTESGLGLPFHLDALGRVARTEEVCDGSLGVGISLDLTNSRLVQALEHMTKSGEVGWAMPRGGARMGESQ